MLARFQDFIDRHPNCKKFEDDDDMQNIFEFLSREYIIIQMIDASEAGKPALTPIVRNVENFFKDTTKEHLNSLDDNFTKQAVGLMVKTVLEPFGYVVWKQKDIPKKAGAEKFQSASTYRFDALAPRTMKITKRVEKI